MTRESTTTADAEPAIVAVEEPAPALVDRARTWWDRIQEGDGDRHFPYTILAVLGIVLLGLVVVPLSIPDPLPEPDPAQVKGEQYLLAFAASGSPTAAQKLEAPALDTVVSTYGTDGGTACTGSMAEAYDTLVTKTAGGGTTFDKAGFAQMKVAHSVYCPERSVGFGKFVARKAALNKAARARAAASAT